MKYIIVNRRLNLYWTGRHNKSNQEGFSADINESKIFSSKPAAMSAVDNNMPYRYGYMGLQGMKDAEIVPVEVNIKCL